MRQFRVFDIETKISPNFSLPDDLLYKELRGKIFGYGVIFDSETNYFSYYLEHEVQDFIHKVLNAEFLVGFNHKRFDCHVLAGYASKMQRQQLSQKSQLDILEDFHIRVNKRFRVSQENIAQATVGLSAKWPGSIMPQLISEEKWEQVKTHCQQDVMLSREIFLYGCKNKKIYYWDKVANTTRVLEGLNWHEL